VLCQYAECHVLYIFMLNVVVFSVVTLSAVMPNVVIAECRGAEYRTLKPSQSEFLTFSSVILQTALISEGRQLVST
jgi:hypothetical protein